jgi:hypothetical protein
MRGKEQGEGERKTYNPVGWVYLPVDGVLSSMVKDILMV